jgi:bifunctional DNA-binding transcriptional regulator/antitoxin component of YhaV-PrlF toxin-antitoxin module
MDITMENYRVVRTVGESKGSLYVIIPRDFARFLRIRKGDKVEWTEGAPGELRLERLNKE